MAVTGDPYTTESPGNGRIIAAGGHVDSVDGNDGLEMFGTGSGIDLVLTDLHMPGMGGRSLAREVLRRRPDAKILLMSAHPIDQEIDEPDLDVDGLLSKPF